MSHSIKIDNKKETKWPSRPEMNVKAHEEVKVTPDWNQTDPDAPDYIKNKTHGSGYINEIDNPFELNIEVMPGGYYEAMSSWGGSFPESEKYALMSATYSKFDGENVSTSSMMDITECPYFIVPAGVISDEETYGYGNPFLYGCGEDNGLAIAVVKNSSDSWLGCRVKIKDISSFYGTAESGNIDVCIGTNYKIGYIPLDEKYIPDTIARKTTIDTLQETINGRVDTLQETINSMLPPLVVTITGSGPDSKSYTCSHTFSEIVDAVDEGRLVVARAISLDTVGGVEFNTAVNTFMQLSFMNNYALTFEYFDSQKSISWVVKITGSNVISVEEERLFGNNIIFTTSKSSGEIMYFKLSIDETGTVAATEVSDMYA